jgi:hypothetical protein
MKTYKAVSYKCGESGTIVPMDQNRVFRLGFTYLHGKLENKAGYDIFGFVDAVPNEEGMFDVMVMFPDVEIKSTLFLWKCNETKGFQGLCVDNNDIEHFEDAKDKFTKKEYCI